MFTNPKWIGRFAQIAQAYVPMAGRDIIISLPANTGIVVNPESDLGFELPWQGVAALRNELRIP